MRNDKVKIIEELKQRLEYTDTDTGYSQWLLGVVISTQSSSAATCSPSTAVYTARVVVKTSTSPYVDGMDIFFYETQVELLIDPDCYENSPDFHGGTVEDSLSWLRELGEIAYLQLEVSV